MSDKLVTKLTVQALSSASAVDGAAVDGFSGAPTGFEVVGKKRGRPPRIPASSSAAKKRNKKEKEDEDVCFICFDGGSLVLCDRRDCPKAYHPACVKRDESFFLPDIRWDCGWHLCNICRKNAIFMCYTCPYSLCKGCVKQADIVRIRGNKGFCRTCMSTIMLIEKIPQENKELAQVDFDDKTSWEYLFKVYWIYLKEKETLTLDELLQASNPCKGSELKIKNNFQKKSRDPCYSNTHSHSEADTSKRRKSRKQQQPLIMDSQKIDKAECNKVPGLLGQPDWASKELLEFVAYMKNGDMSSVSEFDVQALLLDYIKNNNLRDPRQKCQIICDKRLEKLFGKERVGHFEMLKLLEYHFKEESSSSGVIRGAAVNPLSGQLEEGVNVDIQTPSKDTRRQSRKSGDDRGRQIDLDAYAAIDTHNINLIYVKLGLLEALTVDAEKFHDKVIGSVVRIKLSSNDQKQDMHRLVRIIGTSRASKPYKIGDKVENLMLKILNLNKIEEVAIDAISDQDFSEDECRRLRQSIKLGLVERMTVGEIQEKAMALQAVRVANWLEKEIRRLNHLRDRASEMGRQKKLREFVEKIELLRTPEERQRRILRIPEVHADPRMDPSYGSDDDSGESDMKRRDGALTPKYSKSYSNSVELISPCRVGDISKNDKARILKAATANEECKRKYSDKFHADKVEGVLGSLEPSRKTKRADNASRVLEPDSRTDSSVVSGNHGVETICSISQCNSDLSKGTSRRMLVVSDTSELEKIWLYEDPSGKVQGPFCLLQLRKWDSNDFFPYDLKVWRTNETYGNSILLNDALKKQQYSESHFQQRSCLKSRDGNKLDEEKVYSVGVMNSNSVTSWVNDQTNDECSKSNLTDTTSTPEAIEQSMNGYTSQADSDGQGGQGQSSVQFSKAQLIESLFNIEEPSLDATANLSPEMMHVDLKSESSQPNAMSMFDNVDVVSLAVKSGPPSPDLGRPDLGTSLHIASEGIEASDLPGSMPVSDYENMKDLPVDNEKVSDVPASLPKTQNMDKNNYETIDKHCTDSHEQDSGVDSIVSSGTNVSVLPNTGQRVENDGMKCHDAENTQSISLNVLGGDSGYSWSTVTCGRDVSLLPNKEIKATAVGKKYYSASNVLEEVSGTSWSTISGGILVSDLPSTSPKPDTHGLEISITENKDTPTPNILSQDSVINWSNMIGGMEFPVIATDPLKLDVNDSRGAVVENNLCPPPQVHEQDFCINWSTASRLGGEVHLPDAADEWGWQPIELSTLGDDSVSDLLSEVEAMEALRGMSSPTSQINCGDDSIGSPGDDCFSPLEGLTLNLGLGKNDPLSSTSNINFDTHPNHRDPPHVPFHVDICDIPSTTGNASYRC